MRVGLASGPVRRCSSFAAAAAAAQVTSVCSPSHITRTVVAVLHGSTLSRSALTLIAQMGFSKLRFMSHHQFHLAEKM